jgi:hypothetical protein
MDSGVLIEPIVDNKNHGYAVQAKRFSFGLKITNCTNIPTKVFEISSVSITSANGQDISEHFGNKKFSVPVINPEESITVKIGDNGQFMSGLVSVKVFIRVKDEGDQIDFLQKNPFTNDLTKISVNYWIDFLYIKSSAEYRQEISTKWIIGLTWTTVILSLIQILSIIINN